MRNNRIDGQAIFRRSLDHRHVAQAQQRHVQRAGYRRSAHCQNVDVVSHLLETLFMLDPKALLFIYNQQPEIIKLHVGRQKPVSTDKHIDFPGGEIFQYALNLLWRAKTADELDTDRK